MDQAHRVFSLFKDLCEQNPHLDVESFLDEHSEVADEVRQMFSEEERVRQLLEAILPEFSLSIASTQQLSDETDIEGFTLKQRVGSGGMGIVFRAQHPDQSREVAIKRIRSANACTPQQLARFRFEQELLERLEHPRIVKLFTHGVHQGHPYFVMQLMKGGSLRERKRASVKEEILNLVPAIEATQYAHEHGIIHCDLKPSNILFDDANHAFISDFGLAWDAEMTLAGDQTPGGSFFYMAPERHASNAIPTVRSDIFSLGAVLLDRVTVPNPSLSTTDFLLLDPSEHIRQRLEQVLCPDLRAILAKCLAETPEGRYSNCGALINDLNRWLVGDAVAARVPPATERLVRWCRKNRLSFLLLLMTLTTLASAAFACIGFMLSLQNSAEQNRRLADKANQLADTSAKQAERAILAEKKALAQVRRIQEQFKLLSSLFAGLNPEIESLDGSELRDKITQNLRNTVRTLSQLSTEISPDEIELAVSSSGILHDIGFQKEATTLLQEFHTRAQSEFGIDSTTAILLELELARARMFQEDDNARVERIERLTQEIAKRLEATDRRRLRAEMILAESWLGYPDKCEASQRLFASIASRAVSATSDCCDMREIALHGVGAALHGLQRLPEAHGQLLSALRYSIEIHGDRHVMVMRIHHHLGNVCRDLRDFKASCDHLERAYKLGSELLGRENGETAVALNMLLRSCAEGKSDPNLARRLTELLPEAEESSNAMFRILGDDHTVAIQMAGNVAAAAEAAEELSLCVEIRRGVLGRIEKSKGADSLEAVRHSRDLAFTLLLANELGEAKDRLSRFVEAAPKHEEITSEEIEQAQTSLSELAQTAITKP